MTGFHAAQGPTGFADAASLGKGGFWRDVLCWLVLTALYLAGAALLFAASWLFGTQQDKNPAEDFFTPLTAFIESSLLGGFAFAMLAIAMLLPATAAAVTLVHRRRWITLLTAKPRLNWGAVATSTLVTFLLLALWMGAVIALLPGAIRFHPDWDGWARFLPFVIALIPLQTLAEEMLFRGYLLQTVGAVTARPALRLILPAAVFWVMHLWNPEVEVGAGWALADYALIALYLTWLVIRADGVEHAWGVHMGLNGFLALVLTISPGTLTTPAPFTLPGERFALGFAATLALIPLHYLLVFRVIPAVCRRR
jgi:membrane protease YdiL (CAAX protease family)